MNKELKTQREYGHFEVKDGKCLPIDGIYEMRLIPNLQTEQPSDQHLLDDGWIRHTGDVCPVHALDEVRGMHLRGSIRDDLASRFNWQNITRYKVTKKYDPHAENKALYAKDALVHEEPWLLWESSFIDKDCWFTVEQAWTMWISGYKYRRKQTKKLVDWSCPLLKGASTNYGEIFDIRELIRYGNVICSQGSPATNLLRLAHTDATSSNWQAYNGENLSLLHEAGFVVEVKYCDGKNFYVRPFDWKRPHHVGSQLVQYRVIGIRDGFTDDAKEIV